MRISNAITAKLLLAIAIATIALQGCVRSQHLTSVSQPDSYADSHLHIANYAMQGVLLKVVIDRYMGDNIARSTVFGLPFQQKWDRFEHYVDDKMPPNYYLGPKAGVYYYSYIDAMIATEFLKLSSRDKARLDPMIVGFNPMDQYGVQHIKRMLLMYPGVFTGIGEFSVHKELIGDKISDDTVKSVISRVAPIPPDVTDTSRNTLYNPSLKTILDFAGEAGLVVNLHSDVYRAEVTNDGKVVSTSPREPYSAGMKHLCTQSPTTTVYWAHAGLGRFVKPASNHLDVVSDILDACPNWYAELSWDLVQVYIVRPEAGMPPLAEWTRFVTKYQNRLLWGSDTVMYTRNKIDDQGNVTMGAPMPVEEYLAVKDILKPLWDAVGVEVARKVKIDNYVRLFDAAKAKVRAWEAAHAKDDVWNLPPK
jgi:hypothetical protein